MIDCTNSFIKMSETLINLDLDNFDDSPFHVHLKDHNGKYITCNKRVVMDAGLKNINDLLGLTDFDFHFLPKSQALKFREHDKLVATTGKSQFFIEPISFPDKGKMIAISHKTPLRLKSKKIIGTKSLSFIVDTKDYLLKNIISTPVSTDSVHLTKQQLNCLYYLVKGMTMKQIAAALNLSPRTVEHYLNAIKVKLNCYSRTELISKALQIEIIKDKLN